jgi:hypothetical protein
MPVFISYFDAWPNNLKFSLSEPTSKRPEVFMKRGPSLGGLAWSSLAVATALVLATSCQKLGYKPNEVPVTFGGIKSIFETKAGTYVVNWDEPENAKDLVDSYEIYISDLSSYPTAKLAEDPPISSGSTGSELGGLIVNMADNEAPAALGKVLAAVRSENNYTIEGLSPGNYGIQVKVVGKNGTRDTNRRVALLSVVLSVQFSGVKQADYDARTNTVELKWTPFETKLKGESIHYAVFQGETFSDSERIAFVTANPATGVVPNTYVVSVKEQAPGTKLSFGVRVKDPLGRYDTNVNTVSITIPNVVAEDICLSAEAVSSVKTRVTFQFPVDANKVSIRRNGFLITTITDKSVTTFDDFPLMQGTKYEYSCEASRFGHSVPGKSVYSAITRSSDPPTFNGIKSATRNPANGKVTVTWDDGTNVPVAYYNVFASPGPVVQWSKGRIKEVNDATVATVLETLGDEFTYSIGVRACSIANFCDDNNKGVQVIIPDAGAPKTQGATAVELVMTGSNGPRLIVTAPWSHGDGLVKTRYIYFHRAAADTPATSAQLTNLANYTKRAFEVPDSAKWSPQTSLELTEIQENSIYTIIVRDADAIGQESTNTTKVTITTPDFAAPSFDDGVTSLELGSKDFTLNALDGLGQARKEDMRDEALIARFKAPPESESVSHYQVYLREVSGAADLVCPAPSLVVDRSNLTQGTLYGEIAVSDTGSEDDKLIRFIKASESAGSLHTPGADAAILVKGLKERTDYIVCLRARDANNNISVTTIAKRKSTIDVTPPLFDGIQGLEYVKEQQAVRVSWNPSSSPDTLNYILKVWTFDRSTEPDSTPNTKPEDAKYFEITHPSSGTLLTNDMVNLGSNYNVFVVADACDSGARVPSGQKNCKEFDLATASKLQLADILPPPGCRSGDPGCVPFAGILNASQLEQTQVSDNEVSVKVKWAGPQVSAPGGQTEIDAAWVDFKGFKVYSIEDGEKLVLLKDCPAKVTGQYMTSCDVDGFDPFRDYRLHVRAYDFASPPNETVGLSTVMQSASIRTIDTTPPSFIPNLKTEYDPATIGISINWNQASDNQYTGTVDAVISYEIYRKKGSDIVYDTNADPNRQNPNLDNSVLKITTVNELSYKDTNSIEGGTSYYYTVCAVDGSGNRRCPGVSKKQDIDDTTPPEIKDLRIVNVNAVIDTGNSNVDQRSLGSKSWDIVWDVQDNKDATSNLYTWACVEISEVTAGPNEPQTDCAPALGQSYNSTRISSVGGPADRDVYVNYRFFVQDLTGLVTSRAMSVLSTNKITLESVKADEGSTSGGQLLVVTGSGFHSTSKVKIGDKDCENLDVISDDRAICNVPSVDSAIQATVQVETSSVDEKGVLKTSKSSSEAPIRYKYCDGASCVNICNDQSRWVPSATPFAKGSGLSDDPWLICTWEQLDAIRTKNAIRVGSRDLPPYFKLGANIDLKSRPVNSFQPIRTTLRGGSKLSYFVVDGDGFVVANFTYQNPTEDYVGLFGYFWAAEGHLQNIGAINVDVQGKSFVGGLAARSDNSVKTFTNVFVTGKVRGELNYVGGVLGYSSSVINNASANVDLKSSDGLYVGGLVGQLQARAAGKLKASGQVVTGCRKNKDGNSIITYGDCYVGGLFGQYDGRGEITGASFSGIVKADWDPDAVCGTYSNGTKPYCQAYRVGGLIGLATQGGEEFKITNSSVNGQVSGDYDVGGILGSTSWHGSVVLDNVKFNGSVTASREFAGGILGRVETHNEAGLRTASMGSGGGPIAVTISNASVNGSVTNTNKWSTSRASNTGGIVGGHYGHCPTYYIDGSEPTALLKDSYSFAKVTVNGNSAGGAVGALSCAKIVNVKSYGDVATTSPTAGSIGGLVGWIRHGIIDNSQATGNVVAGGSNIGGFFGYIEWGWGMISNSSASGNVRSSSSEVGGFGGQSWLGFKGAKPDMPSKIINCSASGSVTSTLNGDSNVGGFIGLIRNGVRWNWMGEIPAAQAAAFCVNSPEISTNGCSVWAQYENNRATGNVSVVNGRRVGGFVGLVESTYVERGGYVRPRDELLLSKNSATGSVVASSYAGGFVGFISTNSSNFSLKQNFSRGDVNVAASYAGGFVGQHDQNQAFVGVTISDNYARGNVTAGVGNAAGFGPLIHLIYQKSYATGRVEGAPRGGFSEKSAAYGSGGLGGMPSTYFDKTAAGVSTSPYSTGKTTPEMQTQSTFVGFDFDSIWKMPEGGGYPVFKWQ